MIRGDPRRTHHKALVLNDFYWGFIHFVHLVHVHPVARWLLQKALIILDLRQVALEFDFMDVPDVLVAGQGLPQPIHILTQLLSAQDLWIYLTEDNRRCDCSIEFASATKIHQALRTCRGEDLANLSQSLGWECLQQGRHGDENGV